MEEQTEIKKTKNKSLLITLVIFLIVIVVVGGGVYLWQWVQNSSVEPVQINPEELLIFEVKDDNITDFQRDRAFNSYTTAKNEIIKNYNNEEGYDSQNSYYPWLQVAQSQKMIGDYSAAASTWAWFTDAHSGNSVSPANLGDLYKSFIVDAGESEKYYKIALEREKHDFQIYYGFHELYRYVIEDSEKAIDILKQGMENNPGDIQYVGELARYLVKLDDNNQASEIIEKFISDNPDATQLREILK